MEAMTVSPEVSALADPPAMGDSADVVVRTKNRLAFLKRALNSLYAQTWKNWRAIIVNDGGDQDQLELFMNKYLAELPPGSGDKIKIIHHATSVGRGAAFNAGLALSDGTFVGCLDDDDEWLPTFLSDMIGSLRLYQVHHPDVGAVCCRVVDIYEQLATPYTSLPPVEASMAGPISKVIRTDNPWRYNNAEHFVVPYYYLVGRHDCLPVQLLFVGKHLKEFGGFSESVPVLEDRALILSFLFRYRICICAKELSNHYLREGATQMHADLRNSMGDDVQYDWHRYFRSIESDLFYRLDQEGGTRDELMMGKFAIMLAQARQDIEWRLDSKLGQQRPVMAPIWKEIKTYVRKHKQQVYWGTFAAWLLTVVLSALIARIIAHIF